MIDTSIEIDGARVIVTIVADSEEEAEAIARMVMERLKQGIIGAVAPEGKSNGV